MTNVLLLASGLALAIVPTASAQSPNEPPPVFVVVGGGYQMADRTVTTTGTFTLYDESGSFTGSRSVGTGPFFEVGGGFHLFGPTSIGVLYSRYTKSSDVPFTVVVPHPLYFPPTGQPRTVSMNVNDLRRTEDAVHIQFYYQLFSSSRYDASIAVGPSIYVVSEDSVKEIKATETGPPYTTVNVEPTIESASKTGVGYNVSFDFNYYLTNTIGAGAFFRYTGASVDLPGGKVTAGGPQLGAVLRYNF